MPSGAGSHWGKLQNSAPISSGVDVKGRATAFKVVDVLGFSGMVDYEEMFKQAGVEVELVKNFSS